MSPVTNVTCIVVNLDFQTGLSEKHQLLGMLNARWVEWTEFNIACS